MFYLRPDFAATLPEHERTLDRILAIDGVPYREMNGRRTIRFMHVGKPYFLKTHIGVGWKEIFKNLIQLRLPVVSARREWNAIHRLAALEIDTVKPVGYGCQGRNPARLKSFLISEDLGDTVTLEEILLRWKKDGFMSRPDIALKRWALKRIATIARSMHDNGITHRDFYLCHLRMDASHFVVPSSDTMPRIYVMDLHRAQLRNRRPLRRWVVKDLGELYFSAMNLGITTRDRCRFVQAYSGLALRNALSSQQRFWRKVEARAFRLFRKVHDRP